MYKHVFSVLLHGQQVKCQRVGKKRRHKEGKGIHSEARMRKDYNEAEERENTVVGPPHVLSICPFANASPLYQNIPVLLSVHRYSLQMLMRFSLLDVLYAK